MKTLPLSNRLIKVEHKVLVQEVRGQEKNLEEFRYSQNWIGSARSTLKNAEYLISENIILSFESIAKLVAG